MSALTKDPESEFDVDWEERRLLRKASDLKNACSHASNKVDDMMKNLREVKKFLACNGAGTGQAILTIVEEIIHEAKQTLQPHAK